MYIVHVIVLEGEVYDKFVMLSVIVYNYMYVGVADIFIQTKRAMTLVLSCNYAVCSGKE